MLYREKRDGVDLKAFSLFLLLSSRSPSIATCRKWQEKWSWGMKEEGHNRGHLGWFIFDFIIKNELFIDEVALPDLCKAKPSKYLTPIQGRLYPQLLTDNVTSYKLLCNLLWVMISIMFLFVCFSPPAVFSSSKVTFHKWNEGYYLWCPTVKASQGLAPVQQKHASPFWMMEEVKNNDSEHWTEA